MTKTAEPQVDPEIAELAGKVLGGPHRKDFLRLVKKTDPTIPIPEVDVDEGIEARVKPLEEQIAALKDTNEKNQALLNLNTRRKPLKDKGLSDAEIDAVEKFMVEKGIAKHETAYEFMQEQARVAKPSTPVGGIRQPMQMPEVVTKEFFKSPTTEARKVASQVLSDIRSGKAV